MNKISERQCETCIKLCLKLQVLCSWFKWAWNEIPKSIVMVVLGVLFVPTMHFLEGVGLISKYSLNRGLYLWGYVLSFILLFLGVLFLYLQVRKNKGKYSPYFYAIFLMVVGISASILIFLWEGEKNSYEPYYWMIVSVATSFFGIGGLLESMTNYYRDVLAFQKVVKEQGDKFKELAQNYQNFETKIQEFAVWREESEVLHTISLKVYNMDDYIINLPFLLSQKAFQGEKLQVTIENCYTDEKAIEKVLEYGGIAIADPYYVPIVLEKNPSESELIILSPLIMRNPLKHLKKEGGGKILVYDASVDSTAGRLSEVKTRLTVGESDNADVVSLKKFVRELLGIINAESFWQKSPKDIMEKRIEYQNVFRDLAKTIGKNKGIATQEEEEESLLGRTEQDIHWYERFIYILSFWDFAQEEEKTQIRNYFQQYAEFYLMEPEFTIISQYILKEAGYKSACLPDSDRNIIFTLIITTRSYLRNYPLVVLKFLKAIRVGILRTHSVLNVGNIERISRELRNNSFGQDAHYKSAIERILDFLEKSKEKLPNIKELYPEDVAILKESDDYYPYLIGNRGDLSDYLLERFEKGDKELKEKAQFIRDGLGIRYDQH